VQRPGSRLGEESENGESGMENRKTHQIALTDSRFPIPDSRRNKTGKARALSRPGSAGICSFAALKFGSIQLSDRAEPV
jgi:hypothetical protein